MAVLVQSLAKEEKEWRGIPRALRVALFSGPQLPREPTVKGRIWACFPVARDTDCRSSSYFDFLRSDAAIMALRPFSKGQVTSTIDTELLDLCLRTMSGRRHSPVREKCS